MLLRHDVLAGIVDGSVKAVFRRWVTPRVKAGSTFRTPVGIITVERIEPAPAASITERSAREAGFVSRTALVAELQRHRAGRLYRIALRFVGHDPRVALRNASSLTLADVESLQRQLARLGAKTAAGPWADPVLRAIQSQPAVRAAELATRLGMPTVMFKPRVRQLKELGLIESLDVGYRLSPRGEALLRHVGNSDEPEVVDPGRRTIPDAR